MTAQIPDSFLRDGKRYDIVAIEEEWPFTPKQHGFHPVPASTACWRGYFCEYGLRATLLVLESLHVRDEEHPVWRNVAPVKDEYWDPFRLLHYRGVDLPIAYSGRMIIADDFLRDLYIHLGYQRPYAYRRVTELTFDDGTLLEERDHSAAMERLREQLRAARAENPRARTALEIEEVVRKAFSTSYADKWFLDDPWP